jgi:transcriptional regulator with XRE-family HTH domain
MKLQIEVGKRIQQIRKALNLTQEEFGQSLGISKASLSEVESGKYKASIDLLEGMVKKCNVNLHFVITGEGEMFMPPTASAYARAVKFAVNLEDVRDFLYHFERSSILQYFILSQYKTKMMTDRDLIEREIKAAKSNQPEEKEEES